MSDVETLTFGCRLNIVESEAMRKAATAAGERGLIIVNTCAVTAESVRQSAQAIRRMRRERPEARIVVTGCAAQIERARFAAMPEIDRLIDNRDKTNAALWRTPAVEAPAVHPAPVASPAHTRAFVDIQNGCDHRCTFCVIPFGRGFSRSRSSAESIGMIQGLVEAGYREVVLTGVDLTSWGADLPRPQRFGSLVRDLLRQVPGLARLRLSSIDCGEIDEDLWTAIAEEPRLMPHLHLSLQSGSDLILKRMKRRHSRGDAVRVCERARSLRPGLAIGADLIAGFPTETESMFEQTQALIADCGLSFLHVFPFSARPETPAARMPQVPAALIRERASRLRAAADHALERHLAAQIGARLRVLTEKGGRGHAEDFTPVTLSEYVAPGELIDVTIAGRDARTLKAVPVASCKRSDAPAYGREEGRRPSPLPCSLKGAQ